MRKKRLLAILAIDSTLPAETVARCDLTVSTRTHTGVTTTYAYDPIGNRRSSVTYNEKGEAHTSTYAANNLNQYTTRTTPGYAAVRGEADPNATVTVNENPTFRLGSYYFGSDLFDNSTAGGLANLETYATLAQTAANGEETEDLVSSTTNQVYLAQSSDTFAYDDDGNQTLITTKTGLWRVTYNGENRPIRWERDSDNTAIVMSYDYMGRRRAKNAKRFFYDGYLQVADNCGNVYMWDSTESVETIPLVWNALTTQLSDPTSVFYAHDGNKNVREIIDVSCTIAAHYEYALFGTVIAECGNFVTTNLWRFSSEYADDDLGLVYYNDRHYDTEKGRWLSRDWVENVNAYLICRNNVSSFVDEKGALSFQDVRDVLMAVMNVAESAKNAYDAAVMCLGTVSDWRPGSTRGGDTSDKYRHCLASCELSVDCGEKISYALGFVKELRDVWAGISERIALKIGQVGLASWLYDLLEGNTPLEAAKDLLADYDGLMCTRKRNRKSDCGCCCETLNPK